MKTANHKRHICAPAPANKFRRPGISDCAMILLAELYDDISGKPLDEATSMAVDLAELIQHHPALQEETKHLRAMNAAYNHFTRLSNESRRL